MGEISIEIRAQPKVSREKHNQSMSKPELRLRNK